MANDIEVRPPWQRTDADIAQDAARALELRATVPAGVQASVSHGHMTLTGTVPSLFEKDDAENAVHHIRGVRSLLNQIVVAPLVIGRDVRKRIVRALHQNAELDARRITVEAAGTTVTLTGTVDSWLERDSAGRAAANAPGVIDVDNRIVVEPASDRRPEDRDELC